MHIAEGIITGWPVLAYTIGGVLLMAIGTQGIKTFQRKFPDRKPLIGMGAALVFFISLIPFRIYWHHVAPLRDTFGCDPLGTEGDLCADGNQPHPAGGIFCARRIWHLGRKSDALGFVGGTVGWSAFQVARRVGLPILFAGCAGGLLGDIATYAVSGIVLATALATAPHPQYDFLTYLTVIYSAYAPIQIPIAIGEMLITGLALRHALLQRPEVLEDLNVWRSYATA